MRRFEGGGGRSRCELGFQFFYCSVPRRISVESKGAEFERLQGARTMSLRISLDQGDVQMSGAVSGRVWMCEGKRKGAEVGDAGGSLGIRGMVM